MQFMYLLDPEITSTPESLSRLVWHSYFILKPILLEFPVHKVKVLFLIRFGENINLNICEDEIN